MNISELIRDIDNLALLYIEIDESKNGIEENEDAETIKKLAYSHIVDYAVLNYLELKGFDFKRYKSDNDYLWYEELLKILESLQGLKRKAKYERISSELSYLFGYLGYKFRNVDFK